MDSIYVVGTGFYLPEERVTNADLIETVDTSEEWISTRVGIRERRRAAEDENTSDLAALATQAALERSGWNGEDLDLLVCATSTPDALIPATASFACKRLGIDPVAFDVNAACSGFAYGISVADSMIRSGRFAKVAMVTAEKYTRVTDYSDRATCIFFGDSAGTLLLSNEKPKVGLEVVDWVMANMNEGAECVTTPIGGFFWQDGAKVKEYALRGFRDSALEILERNNLQTGDLCAFVGHQANYRVLQTVCDTLGIHESQHWHNVRNCGNQGAAGAATAFCQHLESETLSEGDFILATTFGSGFTTGSVLFRAIA